MRRTALVGLVILGLVGWTTNVHADGLAVNGWGTNCWGSGSDADADGLEDVCEEALAETFMPFMWFDSGESGYGRRPYFAAKSISYSAKTIGIFMMNTYYDDTGIISGHDGDPEFQIVELHYSTGSGKWYVDWVYMSAHRLSWCDSSSWYYYNQVEYWQTGNRPNAYRGYPGIYVAEDKHATYNTVDNCDDGCAWTDYCSYYTWQHMEPSLSLANRNVGSLSNKLINRVDYNGETEYLLNDTDFTGWDNNWYRSNSDGYYQHLSYFDY